MNPKLQIPEISTPSYLIPVYPDLFAEEAFVPVRIAHVTEIRENRIVLQWDRWRLTEVAVQSLVLAGVSTEYVCSITGRSVVCPVHASSIVAS